MQCNFSMLCKQVIDWSAVIVNAEHNKLPLVSRDCRLLSESMQLHMIV